MHRAKRKCLNFQEDAFFFPRDPVIRERILAARPSAGNRPAARRGRRAAMTTASSMATSTHHADFRLQLLHKTTGGWQLHTTGCHHRAELHPLAASISDSANGIDIGISASSSPYADF